MSADAAPWWHSNEDVLADEDPLAQHLSARAARLDDEPPTGAGSTGAGSRREDDRRDELPDDHDPACEVCPICRGIAHVRRTHPEVAEHLVEAARHLSRALGELLDDVAGGRPGESEPHGPTGFTAIRLDDDQD